ncbi:hypothetical protein [Tenacibaculum halocynthiae]|uniref:hypothetical protein n=1 Tax=Tenacibaculum halocynthiae TaxID=1254437 RepID=UPI0038B4835B
MNFYLVTSKIFDETQESIKIIPENVSVLFSDEEYKDKIYHSKYHRTNDLSFLDFFIEEWQEYENVAMILSVNEIKINSSFFRKSWKDYTNLNNSFIFFKGIEDSVVWIGKSISLNFPDIESIRTYNPTLSGK